MKYSKPPKTYQQQIKILLKCGLIIKDELKAKEILNQ